MAIPRRTEKQKAEVAAFLKRLCELSKAESTVEFASRAGLHSSNVGEYLRGDTMPDGYTLLRLMNSVGVSVTARGEAVDVHVSAAPRARQAELQAAVDELLAWQERVIPLLDAHDERLDAQGKRLERLEKSPAGRRKTG